MERKKTLLETEELARERCRGDEENKLRVVSILLLINTVRGHN